MSIVGWCTCDHFFFSSAIDINGLTAMRRKDHFFTKHRDYRDEFVETFTTRNFFCHNIICTQYLTYIQIDSTPPKSYFGRPCSYLHVENSIYYQAKSTCVTTARGIMKFSAFYMTPKSGAGTAASETKSESIQS